MQYADNFASMLASASLKWLFISVCNAFGCRSSKGEQFRKHSRYETFSPSLSCDMIIASNKKKVFHDDEMLFSLLPYNEWNFGPRMLKRVTRVSHTQSFSFLANFQVD